MMSRRNQTSEGGARILYANAVNSLCKTENFHFDDEEVSEVRWVKYGKMEEFRKKYAKAPLKKDDLTFEFLRTWLEMHGNL